jgi:hypothetical protein
MLRRLTGRGIAEVSAEPRRYRLSDASCDLDPEPLRHAQVLEDPSWLPSYTLAETVAQDYPAFLRGERTGEEVLFSPARLRLWVSFFSNDNAYYAVNNLVGAIAVEAALPLRAATILELGGTRGAAAALVSACTPRGRLASVAGTGSPKSSRLPAPRGGAGTRFPDATFWIHRPGHEPPSRSGRRGREPVARLRRQHRAVARDLHFTLRESSPRWRRAAGWSSRSACALGPDDRSEFIFNLMQTFRSPILHRFRPNGGFLTPGQWRAALEAAGFADIEMVPDVAHMGPRFPNFCVAAIRATRP